MNRPIPKLKKVQPKAPLNALDRIQVDLDEARDLYLDVLNHARSFKASVKEKQAKLHPDGPGTPLRDFVPISPTDGWFKVNDRPICQVSTLERHGLIATVWLDGVWLASPAPESK